MRSKPPLGTKLNQKTFAILKALRAALRIAAESDPGAVEMCENNFGQSERPKTARRVRPRWIYLHPSLRSPTAQEVQLIPYFFRRN